MSCGWEQYVADAADRLGREPTEEDLTPQFELRVSVPRIPYQSEDERASLYEAHLLELGQRQSRVIMAWERFARLIHGVFSLDRGFFYTGERYEEARYLLGAPYHNQPTRLGYVYFTVAEIVYRWAYFINGREYPRAKTG